MMDNDMLVRLQTGLPYRRDLRRLVRNILRHDADVEDVLQEVHVAALLAVQIGQEVGDLKRWLMRAARNRAVDVKRARRPDVSLESVEISVEDCERLLLRRESVLVAVSGLPDRQREVVEALIVEGSLPEAAAKLGISVTVARRLLREAVEGLRGEA